MSKNIVPANPKRQESKQHLLINFDFKAKLFLGSLIVLFVFCVINKINYSSVGIWNTFLNDGKNIKKYVLWGKPRQIRSDEYSVGTPSIMSQYYNGFPIASQTYGAANVPLAMSFPVKHFSVLLRPNYWGFQIFDLERGFACYWNFNLFALFISLFLFFMLVTKNSFWVSVFGSFWLVFSSPTQWWYSTPLPAYIYTIAAIFTCTVYLFYSKSLVKQIVSALLLLVIGFNFAVTIYPPWQIPGAYIIVILVASFFISNYTPAIIFENIYRKLFFLAAIVVVFGIAGFLMYSDVAEAFKIMLGTAYPGKRSFVGGSINNFVSLFHNFYLWHFDDANMPAKWGNICESSGFIMFFPVFLYATAKTLIFKLKPNLILVGLSFFIFLGLVWVMVGLPEIISKVLLLNMVAPERMVVFVGLASVIATIVYIADSSYNNFYSPIEKIVLVAISALLVICHVIYMNNSTDNFFKYSDLFVTSLLFIGLFAMLIFYFKGRNLIFGIIILLLVSKNVLVNPVMKGLDVITKNSFFQTAKMVNDQDKNSRWIVMSNAFLSNFLKAGGLNIFGGSTFIPDLETMHIFDPHNVYDSVYNRYANISASSYISNNDSVVFQLGAPDQFTIAIDPCSPKLKQIGIKYFVFPYQPQPDEVRCLTLVVSNGINIYKRND